MILFHLSKNNMWLRTIILLLVPHLMSSATCGVSRTSSLSDKIVGGRNSEEGEFPWQASLQKLSSSNIYHTCGATLITPEWLVTAAHCIRVSSADSYRIIIGNNNLTAVTGNQIHMIQKIIIKQGFDPITFNNDIALIQLFHPVSELLNPICLTTDAAEANTKAVVTGWGTTENGGKPSMYLQAVDIVVIERKACLTYFGDLLEESMTCAGYDEGGKDACQGDSGGPLLQWRNGQAFLIGVVSWGVKCAEPGFPGVYTDVIQFVSWIKSYTEMQD